MIKFIVEKRGQSHLEGGKEENQAQRCGGDKGLVFTELKGKERRIQQIFVENLSRPGTVFTVKTKTICCSPGVYILARETENRQICGLSARCS